MLYQIEGNHLAEIKQTIAELEGLISERIADLHEVKGGMQARHAYVLYRSLLWRVKYSVRDNMKEFTGTSPIRPEPELPNIKK